MPVLVQGVATRSRAPTLLVENKLEPGSWRFRLTVVDDSGLESAPAELVVRVLDPPRQPPAGPIEPARPGVGPGVSIAPPPPPTRPTTPRRPARPPPVRPPR
jgi:hypothetical protein